MEDLDRHFYEDALKKEKDIKSVDKEGDDEGKQY